MISTVVFASGRAWVRSAFPVSSAIVRASSSIRGSRSLRDPRENLPALARNHARPSGKCLSRGIHSTCDILNAAARDLGDLPAVRWIFDLEHLARRAFYPFATDQHTRFPERCLITARFFQSCHDGLHRSSLALRWPTRSRTDAPATSAHRVLLRNMFVRPSGRAMRLGRIDLVSKR
jgi:hypothetical protein